MERYEKIDISDNLPLNVSRRNHSKYIGLQTPNPNYYSNGSGSISPSALQSRRHADSDSAK